MSRGTVLSNRLLHTIVLTAFVAVALFDQLQAVVPRWELLLAVGVVLAWMLGQRYEREVVVGAGLADRADVIEAEREASSWRSWVPSND